MVMKKVMIAALCCGLAFVSISRADILNWQTGQVIPGTEPITPGPGVDISGWNAAAHNLDYAALSDLDLTSATLSWNWFNYADFKGTNLTGAWLLESVVANADFTDAIVKGTWFDSASGFTKEQLYSTTSYRNKDLGSIKLYGCNLSACDLHSQNLQGAWLSSANLTGATFASANLADADLTSATLVGVDFTDAIVKGTNLAGTTSGGFTKEQLYSTASYKNSDMAGISLVSNNMAAWDFHGQNLTMADFSCDFTPTTDLTSATFAGANLTDAYFSRTSLAGADLTGADLTRTRFLWANMTGANLAGANLAYTSFEHTNLTGASLAGQRLADADLDYTTMVGTNLTGAILTGTMLRGVDLTNADFTDADVRGMSLFQTVGFTKEQLYSTASYASHDLRGIRLQDYGLAAWDFRNQNLTDAYFAGAILTGADFRGANLTNAAMYSGDIAGADFTGAVIRGAKFGSITGDNLTREQLYSTASYADRDLDGIGFYPGSDLAGWDFHGQSLRGAGFASADLTGTDLTDAVVKGADFSSTTRISEEFGLTRQQLYSTASYKTRNLGSIKLGDNTLSGWNLVGQNLVGSSFKRASLSGTDFSLADLRGSDISDIYGTPITRSTIWNDGSIAGLQLNMGDELQIRNYTMAITANDTWTMSQGSAIKMILEGDWQSVINVGTGVIPDLGGTLELGFAEGIDPASLVGTEFKLFNWNGQLTAGDAFDSIAFAPWMTWDTSRLYTDGIVTLTSVPEPLTLAILALGGLALRRKIR
jgi:uncharacterized protein YjbI with pentapeptide repeats